LYEKLRDLFDQYFAILEAVEPTQDGARSDLAEEVRERLAQLAFITAQLASINPQFKQTAMVTKVNESGETEYYNAAPERDEHLRFVMRLLTESFYYFAFRTRTILRNDVHRFSGLRTFDCPGVRDVRNHLIEHPEGSHSRIFNRTFAWTMDTGMQLKSGRHEWESSAFHDAGFNANSEEFAERLSSCIHDAINRLAQRQSSPSNDGA
jgi:hypothetical protein